ncbi:MAG: carbon monoxide dehydrogenase subunit G [Pseudomonadota bacterium]|nr:carbon monoxide dehydrogenase subunit G [Pseudomonadota bacterium]
MKLEGQKTIPAPIERTWAALNDPEMLRASIAGCESLEQTAEDEYAAAMKVRIGPVNARFKGKLKLSDIVAPSSYRIAFEGQGGAAGFGKGNADVRLEPAEGGATLLSYVAEAQVGGKIAQIGSRLVDAAAAKIAEDFFTAFEARLAADTAAAVDAVDAVDAAEGADASAAGEAQRPPTAVRTDAAPAGTGSNPGSGKVLWWVIAAAVIAVLVYTMSG